MQFEEAFDIQIPDEDAEKIKTVKDADRVHREAPEGREVRDVVPDAAAAPDRRVVVTGIGLICGVGNTAPEVWEGLLAGKSGMAEIKAFDLTGHPVRFAAEVKELRSAQVRGERKSPARWGASSTSPSPPHS